MSLNPRANPASSPCIGRCSHNVGDEICKGCGRTVAEVLNWNTLTDEEKISLKAELARRLAEMINIAQIHAQIGGLKAAIKSLEDGLPFADHGAYSQDRDRIRRMEEEIHQLEDQLKEGMGNV